MISNHHFIGSKSQHVCSELLGLWNPIRTSIIAQVGSVLVNHLSCQKTLHALGQRKLFSRGFPPGQIQFQ